MNKTPQATESLPTKTIVHFGEKTIKKVILYQSSIKRNTYRTQIMNSQLKSNFVYLDPEIRVELF